MKQIPLTKGLFAIVDDEDYEFLIQWEWRAYGKNNHIYACARIKGRQVLMHRLLLGLEKRSANCDHANSQTLDNRRCNIRECSFFQNMKNKRKVSGKTTSKYKGVYFHKRDLVWMAKIWSDKVAYNLGTFKDEDSAALAYNEAAKIHHGEFAKLNNV